MEKHCSESSSVGSFACNTKCMEGSAPSSFSSPQQQQQQQEEEEGEAVKEVSKKLKQDTQQAEQELLPLPAPASNADGNQTLLHAPPATETISGMEEEEEDNAYPSAAELVAKARAPVKREFLQKASLRILPYSSTEIVKKENVPAGETGAGAKISVDKKSKRQVKKERTQARKSAENVCAAVAKTGDVNACPFGAKCRFNHDLDSFLAQKPPDLPGACPFLVAAGKGCPYGLACRFAGTHVGVDGLGSVEFANESSQLCEYNFLSKDFQRKLWKRLVSFSKADAELQKLGIKNIMKGKEPPKSGETGDIKPTQVESASNLEDTSAILRMDVDGRDGNHLNVDDSETIMNASIEQEFSNKEIIVPLRENALLDEECSVQENGIVSGEKHDEEKLLGSSNMVPEDMSVIDVHKKKEASLTGDFMECKLTKREKKIIDFRGKLYLAPLTTVGNLPFRRVCKRLGAEITCGEMAMCTNLLQGQASEWALLRRHADEDLFGVQICGSYPDTMARTAELIEKECQVSFVDINVGCPIDIVVNKGAGSCLLTRPARLEQIIRATSATLTSPLTFKVRTGYFEGRNCIHSLIADIHKSGATAISVHGRTRQQRYSKLADWDYIYQCASIASNDLQVIGNGDIFAYTDWNEHMSSSNLSTCMIARGALIKPWIFTEIKEQRHWDITASERLDILKDYVRFGIEHWGSDSKGVETTRHFLLELLSYMHRYIPVGLLEVVPQRLNWRPPNYFGRTELETLMASDSAADWVRISEMLLGPAPANFVFTPRHKSNAYDKVENG